MTGWLEPVLQRREREGGGFAGAGGSTRKPQARCCRPGLGCSHASCAPWPRHAVLWVINVLCRRCIFKLLVKLGPESAQAEWRRFLSPHHMIDPKLGGSPGTNVSRAVPERYLW